MKATGQDANSRSVVTAELSLCRALGAAALACAAIAVASLFAAAPAFAEAPTILGFSAKHVYPTRAFINPIDAGAVETGSGGAEVLPHGLEIAYRFEYAPAESGHAPLEGWLPAGSGTAHELCGSGNCGASVHLFPETGGEGEEGLHHLSPQTAYYIRVEVKDGDGKAEATIAFTTPAISQPEIYCRRHSLASPAVCDGSSFRLEKEGSEGSRGTTFLDWEARVETNGADTAYSFEYAPAESGHAPPEASPAWEPFTEGATGSVTKAEDFALLYPKITGLVPETLYFVRLTAINHCKVAEPTVECSVTYISGEKTRPVKPNASIGLVTAIAADSAHLSGSVYPGTYETHWRFEASSEENGTYAPIPGAEGTISAAEAGEKQLPVQAQLSGLSPASIHFVRLFAENEPEPGHPYTSTSSVWGFETAGPPSEVTTFATRALHGESLRLLGSLVPHTAPVEGGSNYDTHYRFEYAPEEDFQGESCEWTCANVAETPEIDLGAGAGHNERVEPKAPFFTYDDQIVGTDLPPLPPGASYRYRLVAGNDTPGDPVVRGNEQTLTVPVPAEVAPQPPCPNQALRSGASANLPDCRGYELITPVNKEGAQEIFNYGTGHGDNGALAGEDGDHLMLKAPYVSWPGAAGGDQSPYFFTRTGPGAWRLTAASPQPQTGVATLAPQLFSPDLSAFAFASAYDTNPGGPGESEKIEFGAGPPGGPYPQPALAAVPRKAVEQGTDGWVAASRDLSKLILAVHDRGLIPGHETGTTSGADLYEYSQGQWRQVNVTGPAPGTTIGSCGARIVQGREDGGGWKRSSPNAVSADGSRVFFEAVPSSNCSEPTHLYVRLDGAETIDLGPYRFAAANPTGTELLLYRTVAGSTEFFLSTGAGPSEVLFSAHLSSANTSEAFSVSKHLSTVYFTSAHRLGSEAPAIAPGTGPSSTTFNLYRYDIGARALRFVAQTAAEGPSYLSPDGRYYYFEGPESHHQGGYGVAGLPLRENTSQAFRYDSAAGLIQCISCASSFDPEPRLNSSFGSRSQNFRAEDRGGTPTITLVSGDGRYAFFSTPSALVAADVDGEHAVEGGKGAAHGDEDGQTSVSSDIYEWRADGVGGCAHLQGCLALITDGRGGFQNLLLGSADEGRDVFFSTASRLVPADSDTAIDIYDARIGGGTPPPPPRPVECEGDSCANPAPAPNDPTPGTATVNGGGGNVPPVKHKQHKKRHHKKHKRAGHNGGGAK